MANRGPVQSEDVRDWWECTIQGRGLVERGNQADGGRKTCIGDAELRMP